MIVSELQHINETIIFYNNYDLMPAIALLLKESLSWLIKVVTTPRNIEYKYRKKSLGLGTYLSPVLKYNTHSHHVHRKRIGIPWVTNKSIYTPAPSMFLAQSEFITQLQQPASKKYPIRFLLILPGKNTS